MEFDILYVIIGILILIIIALVLRIRKMSIPKKSDGKFVINTTDPIKDVITIEYSANPADYILKKQLIFDVVIEDDLSVFKTDT